METTNNNSSSSSSLTQWDHNIFCLTLAQHLLGRETLHRRLQRAVQLLDIKQDNSNSNSNSNRKDVIRLYWRSDLLQVKLDEQSLQLIPTGTHTRTAQQQQQQQQDEAAAPVTWIDLTWTLTPHEKDMQLVAGQLVLETDSSHMNADKTTTTTTTTTCAASIAAKYYNSPPLTRQHIQRHFEALKVEVSQGVTPTHVYADSIARAFSNLICSADDDDDDDNNSKNYNNYLSSTSIQLYHEDMQTAAPLYEFDASSPISELNETVLRLMLLQQQQHQQGEASSPIDSKESSSNTAVAATENASVQELVSLFQQWQTKVQSSHEMNFTNEVQEKAASATGAAAGILASSHDNKRAAATDDDSPKKNMTSVATKKIRRGGGVHGYSRLPQRKTSSKLRYQAPPKKL